MFVGPLDDRMAIRELHDTYCRGVLTRDPELWSQCWSDDAIWDLMGTKVAGRDEIRALWIQAMDGFPAVSFMVQPLSIEIDGRSATGLAQSQEIMHVADGSHRLVGGRYDDTFVKEGGRWLYSSRRFSIVVEYGAAQG